MLIEFGLRHCITSTKRRSIAELQQSLLWLSGRLLLQLQLRMLGAMSKGASYPNAPVALVAFELRHPSAGRLSSASQTKLKRQLREHLPLLKLEKSQRSKPSLATLRR